MMILYCIYTAPIITDLRYHPCIVHLRELIFLCSFSPLRYENDAIQVVRLTYFPWQKEQQTADNNNFVKKQKGTEEAGI
jgi:hypothetical protein